MALCFRVILAKNMVTPKFDGINQSNFEIYFEIQIYTILDTPTQLFSPVLVFQHTKTLLFETPFDLIERCRLEDERFQLSKKKIAYYMLDAFYREEKRSGAWMNNLRPKFADKLPFVINVCNFAKDPKATLLSL